MKKKQIFKEDGRYLLFYHFPESATDAQAAAFAAIREEDAPPAAASQDKKANAKDEKRV